MTAGARRSQWLSQAARYLFLVTVMAGLCGFGFLWHVHNGPLQGYTDDVSATSSDQNVNMLEQQLRKLLASPSIPATSPILSPAHAGGESTSGVAANSGISVVSGMPHFAAEGPLDDVGALPAPHGVAVGDSAGTGLEAAGADFDPSDEAGSGGDNDCHDTHPNADSPDMLHVVFASDENQVEGVQASVASVVSATASPDELTIHIIVQARSLNTFKERFGIRPECHATVSVTGVLIKVHSVEGQLIEKAVAKVSSNLRKERGAIDTPENFARFYMHLILERAVVIYLDADTIVQADLAELRKQLLASGKTIGFVARENEVRMDKFLRKPKGCSAQLGASWKTLMSLQAYNVGVFAVNLQRWKDQHVVERVEELVTQHNRCGGKLWVGGSQPPLLLAFLNLKQGEEKDYIVFPAEWNYGDLGWRKTMSAAKLQTKKVLHWNGNKKPWNTDGLYREMWLPHRQGFYSLLKPYSASADGGSTQKPPDAGPTAPKPKAKKSGPAVTTTLSPEEQAAREACPSVRLLDEWVEAGASCVMGKSYGCLDPPKADGMYAMAGCAGLFSVSGKATVCGVGRTKCEPGAVPKSADCGLMILTSYFTTKKDWQRGKYVKPTFSKIQKLYQTAVTNGLSVSVLYDVLPQEFLDAYASERFRFVQVNLTQFDKRYGVNDVRYFFFERLVQQNRDWKYIFIVDAFDVRSGMNPCTGMQPGKIYVGGEQDRLKKHPWMKARFQKMGGKYNQWYTTKVTDKLKILNCGLTGGQRDMMLKLLSRMVQVLQDPALAIRQKNEDINLNMAALNYILYVEFDGKFQYGPPVHSAYKRFENKRKDVWWVHK
ncbi:GATL10 [Symbiodinium sp. KB8]|nr:GATL10 [Symbiodinium sp. KB8]